MCVVYDLRVCCKRAVKQARSDSDLRFGVNGPDLRAAQGYSDDDQHADRITLYR